MSTRTLGSRRGLDAIVVGAGVVGSTLALGLARADLRVALVEARPPAPWRDDAPRDLRVYALAPGSVRLLRELQAWQPPLSLRAQAYDTMRVWDAAAPGELCFRAADAGVATLGHIVEQAVIQESLRRASEAIATLALHCPARPVALHQDEHGVRLELDDGACLAAPLLIAADGGDSPLRALAGLQVRAHSYAQRGLVAYVRTALPHADTAWQRFLPGGPLALLPCGDGLGSIVWTLPDAEAERLLQIEPATFERELTRAFDARLGDMQLASERAAFPLRRQLASRYVAGRVVLAGDAAHVVHPLAGQGVNLGLQDAAMLIDLARAAHAAGRDPGGARDLRRYERARRSENTMAAWGFDGLNRLFSNRALLPTLLRGPALGLVDRIAPLKQHFARRAMGETRD